MWAVCKFKLLTTSGILAISLLPTQLVAEPVSLPADEDNPVTKEERKGPLVADDTRERETGADEDPIAQRQVELTDRPEIAVEEPHQFDIYGSLRLHYRDTGLGTVWGDGGSRVGVSGRWQFKSEHWLLGRGETGFNLLDQADNIFNPGGRPPGDKFTDDFFLRLLYIGIETPDYNITAGKNWSTYYRVTSFTDRFQGTGASASGTYNAGTDGGYTGTGRADRVVQTRIQLDAFQNKKVFRPTTLNLQVQHGEPIPSIDDITYQTTIGLSSVFETNYGFAVGAAYNHAIIDDADLPVLRPQGIDGDATALAIGLRWFGKNWYVGTVGSRLENHENTDKQIYFDGTGIEVYAQYRLYGKIWGVAGLNKLTPDSSQTQAGEFDIDYNVIGLRYSFKQFQQLIFANARLESSTTQNGESLGNVYTIGVRWDLP